MTNKKATNEKNNINENDKEELHFLFENAQKAYRQQSVKVTDSETEQAYQKVIAKTKPQEHVKISYLRYAAAALIILGVVGIGFVLTPATITVPEGTTQAVNLADGTTVTLNSGSTLSYPQWFNIWSRTVSLNGEAFFEVNQNGQSFKVETENAVVSVMGTKFNVRSWSAEAVNKTSLYLQEGTVSFSSKTANSRKVILKQGEKSSISGKQNTPVQPQKVEQSKAIAWMQNGLAFQNQPLSVIFEEISRRFKVNIETANEQLLNERLTIYISELKGVQQTLDDICRAKNLQYSKNGDMFKIKKLP
jgi:ferric-dicitrate binding protein FerR (iron transport regulator)